VGEEIIHDIVWLIDFDNPDNNDWLAVNQFTVEEDRSRRRPDIVVFVNGIPLGVVELKNPADENATIKDAFNQFQTYKNEIPSLFPYNEILIASDGIEARLGTLTADWEWFLPWRTITGDDLAPKGLPELEVLIKGIFDKQRFLDLLRYFIVFEVGAGLKPAPTAFYDALETNDSAVKVLGDEILRTIARELVETVKRNVTIDWTVKESVKAKLRTLVKRILRKYGYPPDKQEKAAQTVLSQAELLCAEWMG
jgi:type I site-specific restriction-modification system R (restriction) subunit